MTDDNGVRWLNGLPPPDAERELLACCGAPAWARAVAAARPFADPAAPLAAAEAASAALAWPDVAEALARHPRIGDRPAGDDRESAWSRGEQSGTATAGHRVARDLHAGNLAYEERFGHVFLICATGLSAADMLAALRRRLDNAPAAEREIVRNELHKIARLRLEKLLEHYR
ncbi:2-oxo-4-hydroxy-4-carboxy-5-ureidoimidazoline decarboxylase [Actinomadura craniellae]|uniref:2-oxo-4-hydroxy-4-carboxy-5-ureidoimidazoline decarboxylase n=1 Tax=Actinomadura craniellae TaxID=2231787 RepID=A0A365H2E1_9ACTN|nr:2-oxo-4-hydroxy-4-carboxy-5-ureidoimidazoline decarboxylase [Actinomadura craniellae]RAY13198.1 2-oxo-4-hydroxy-4-carboxy-5-ureidoimidazoline decarboxylase [Actinomadura craniellae]